MSFFQAGFSSTARQRTSLETTYGSFWNDVEGTADDLLEPELSLHDATNCTRCVVSHHSGSWHIFLARCKVCALKHIEGF